MIKLVATLFWDIYAFVASMDPKRWLTITEDK